MVAGDASIMNWVILASAVVPVAIVLVGSWFFLRAGRRWEDRNQDR